MRSRRSFSELFMTTAILLGIVQSVYLFKPSVLLKRSIFRRRLLHTPVPVNGTLRLKRQLFREDIPHHRPLSGNSYYLHAGFPHPSRWHEGPQIILPNPNPITHHHHQHHMHHNLHDPHPPSGIHHHHHENNGLLLPPSPIVAIPVRHKNPHSVTVHSDIVHNSGVVGGLVDNSILHHSHPPPLPSPPVDQANFDQFHDHGPPHSSRKPRPKPHSDPDHYEEFNHGPGGPTGGNYDFPSKEYGGPLPTPLHPPASANHDLLNPPIFSPTRKPPILVHSRKPKTVIHYHPVSVGNIINFNDDHKPIGLNPSSYGPPKHVPGVPFGHNDDFLSMAEPFMKTPFKSISGSPEYLNFNKHTPQYGPPDYEPGPPLDSLGLAPMLPSYGPPLKHDPIPPLGVALPVLAHFHSSHHPPKRYRGRPPLHFHHFHHSPPPLHAAGSPFFDVKYPSYVVHGHAPPNKFPYHSPHFSSRSQLKSFWNF